MTPLAAIALFNALGFLSLGILALWKVPRSVAARHFAGIAWMIGLWSAAFCFWQFSDSLREADIRLRWTLFFGVWVNQALLQFAFAITGAQRWKRTIILTASVGNLFFSFIVLSG